MATATEPVSGQKEVTVSLKKLTEGVGTVFAGVIQMLQSLDASTAAVFAEKLKEGAEAEHETEAAKPHDPAVSDDAAGSAGDAVDPVAEEPTPVVTVDDITKVIVAKIKQKRSNNEVIAKLLKTYKVEKVSELKPSQYEAFLTDISQI